MRAFVHRLVRQLLDEDQPLSRNRHFDTFDDAVGRRALRVSRHLRALERDILSQRAGGTRVAVHKEEREGEGVIRLELFGARFRRVAYLSLAEFEILLSLPGVKEAVESQG
jgi:hypothetical protein